jgi:hypothetical protein
VAETRATEKLTNPGEKPLTRTQYETLLVTAEGPIVEVLLNRPAKRADRDVQEHRRGAGSKAEQLVDVVTALTD